MSENTTQANYSHYDEMPSEQLSEILRKHAHDELEVEPDIEELLYIMEVLSEREKANPNTRMKSPEEAWAIFEEHYMPKSAKMSLKREARKAVHPYLRRIVAAAAVLVLLIMLPISAKALKLGDLWDVVARWAKETFSFVSSGNTDVDDPDTEYKDQKCELQELLVSCNHRADLVPTRVPTGFTLEKIEQDITPVQEVYRASYLNGERAFRIRVQTYLADDFQKIEIEEGYSEVYHSEGVDYYIFENVDQCRAVWVIDHYECVISGDLSIEEIKIMIDSIGKG